MEAEPAVHCRTEEVLSLPCAVSLRFPPCDSVETGHLSTPSGLCCCATGSCVCPCAGCKLCGYHRAVASASQSFPVSPEPPAVCSPVKLSGKLQIGACGYPPVRARNLMGCWEDRPQDDRGHLCSQGSSPPQPSGVVAPQGLIAEASRHFLAPGLSIPWVPASPMVVCRPCLVN